MGKGAIYVVLGILVLVALAAAVWGLSILARRGLDAWYRHRLQYLKETAQWSHYVVVTQNGGYKIGVRRAAKFRGDWKIFDGPIEMDALPPDHDPVERETMIAEAVARAVLYNSTRTRYPT